MLIVSESGYEACKGLLCYILRKWCNWLTDMINCRDAIASKKPNFRPVSGGSPPLLLSLTLFIGLLLDLIRLIALSLLNSWLQRVMTEPEPREGGARGSVTVWAQHSSQFLLNPEYFIHMIFNMCDILVQKCQKFSDVRCCDVSVCQDLRISARIWEPSHRHIRSHMSCHTSHTSPQIPVTSNFTTTQM